MYCSAHQDRRNFGKHSVPADRKWDAIMKICEEQLGVNETGMTLGKLWERLASRLHEEYRDARRFPGIQFDIEGLDHIPEMPTALDWKGYCQIIEYLRKAFASELHPLGRLLRGLVDAFRATYGGVVAHPRLLPYAVQEVHSLTLRTYCLVRRLFPHLPEEEEGGRGIILDKEEEEKEAEEEEENVIITPRHLLHPFLIQPIYSAFWRLFVLENQPRDEEYTRRINTWNKQPDGGLLTFLGVDGKFWDDACNTHSNNCNTQFSEAIETLQLISTAFSPRDKLDVIFKTFKKISQVVTTRLGHKYLWTMDDLFPVVQFVVVRARIQYFGAELEFIEALMDENLQNGEIGLMFTTLKACYYQIQNEKVSYP